MIPASYLYKDLYRRTWGDPRNMQAEPEDSASRGPDRGRFVGLAGLLAAVLPLELDRGHRWVKVTD